VRVVFTQPAIKRIIRNGRTLMEHPFSEYRPASLENEILFYLMMLGSVKIYE
jgi:hypothetical protein